MIPPPMDEKKDDWTYVILAHGGDGMCVYNAFCVCVNACVCVSRVHFCFVCLEVHACEGGRVLFESV